MTFSIVITLPFIIGLAGGVLAIFDGIYRARRGLTLMGILIIIAAALFVLSLFVSGVPFGSPLLAVATIILLVIALAFNGSTYTRGGAWITLVSIILLVAWLVLADGAHLSIPGVNA
ncbi:MAG: hypothetical protein J0G30_09795 [Actinomycetales bacterium]|nr:hypothetical protein [Actinomycetales bacterium]